MRKNIDVELGILKKTRLWLSCLTLDGAVGWRESSLIDSMAQANIVFRA